MHRINLHESSKELLLRLKRNQNTLDIQAKIKKIKPLLLKNSLSSDQEKKAFWINIYNAFYQILRKNNEINKKEVYTKKLCAIAGQHLSLDELEHGILRRYRYKYSLGFFPNYCVSSFVKEHAVAKIDYRIHFALNCGAKSCPPIGVYDPNKINQQLDTATKSFLESESEINHLNRTVLTTRLFKWFYADFGRKKGIKEIFKNQLDRNISDYTIKYTTYSWEEQLNNYSE